MSLDLSRLRPQIESALAYSGGTHQYADVAEMIAAGTAVLFPGPSAAIVAEIVEHPRRRVLNIFLAAGNLKELEAMLPLVLEWGHSKGCQSATFIGRRGWIRLFASRDPRWTETHVMMQRQLV